MYVWIFICHFLSFVFRPYHERVHWASYSLLRLPTLLSAPIYDILQRVVLRERVTRHLMWGWWLALLHVIRFIYRWVSVHIIVQHEALLMMYPARITSLHCCRSHSTGGLCVQCHTLSQLVYCTRYAARHNLPSLLSRIPAPMNWHSRLHTTLYIITDWYIISSARVSHLQHSASQSTAPLFPSYR